MSGLVMGLPQLSDLSRQLMFLSASRSSSSGDESAINKRIGGKPTKSGTFLASARQPIGADPSAFWES